MKSKIFVLQGKSGVGKTTTINKVYQLLRDTKGVKSYKVSFEILNKVDIRAILNINEILVGIECQGDPSSRLKDSLKLFIENKCKVIICASRTRGMSVDWINEYSNEFDIEFISKEHASDDKIVQEQKNSHKAEEIVKMLFKYLNGE
ncbi:hypothetical protein Q6A90_04875 [Aliarcobacter skirrowii]|uniref:hypothetical protein n=1 Tax=Aliarcobacter skirrowii TaxID=28200 RepID=UPI00299FAF25|nr:hypothetical protein [Aliarcobacter skirrowii]MDX4061695.1 hypothetical protein [Aliarcobacter skirrowii]